MRLPAVGLTDLSLGLSPLPRAAQDAEPIKSVAHQPCDRDAIRQSVAWSVETFWTREREVRLGAGGRLP